MSGGEVQVRLLNDRAFSSLSLNNGFLLTSTFTSLRSKYIFSRTLKVNGDCIVGFKYSVMDTDACRDTIQLQYQECEKLIKEGKFLKAKPFVQRLLHTEEPNNTPTSTPGDALDEAQRGFLVSVKLRIEEIERILTMDHSNINEEAGQWIHAMTLFGITTFYQLLPDGLLRIKLEGALKDLPILEQLAVLKEVSLWKEWMPFCSHSSLVHQIHHNELLAFFTLSTPIMSREAVVHALGADCTEEHEGTILLLVKSVEAFQDIVLPELNKGYFGLHDR